MMTSVTRIAQSSFATRIVRWVATIACSTAPAAQLHAAQSETTVYPTKPVRIVVPFVPGGNIDTTARTIAPGLADVLGQQFVIDNRGGGGGRIGAALAAKSPADGYTMLVGANGTMAVQPAFSDNLEYQPLRDFVFASPVSIMPGVVVVTPSLPVRNVRDLIALAKAKPAGLLMSSPGTGSQGHLTGELFQSLAGVKFVHVPYKGGGAASVDLMSGQVHLGFEPLVTPLGHIRAGRLRGIAVTTKARSVVIPDLPTIDESGVPGFDSSTSTVLALPVGTPPDVLRRLRAAMLSVLAQPKVRDSFEKTGGEVSKLTPEEYTQMIREEHARWVRVRKETGIRIE